MTGFVTKKGSRYYVVVELPRLNDGKRRRAWHGGYSTKREAEQVRAELVSSINTASYVALHRRTLGHFLENEWLPAIRSTVKASTFDSYKRNLDLHVIPNIGNVRLQQLTTAQLNVLYRELMERGRADREGGLSNKTVRYIHTIVHKALKDATAWTFTARNVASVATPPRARSTTSDLRRTWSAADVKFFLDSVAQDRLAAAWLVLATTGMRRGEVLGLCWSNVDLGERSLTISSSLVSVAYKVQFSTPKTPRSQRSLQLDDHTMAGLRKHRARQAEERLAWGKAYQDIDLVFAQEDGRPIHPDRLTQNFKAWVAKLELPRIRLHDLRHTFATLALQAGVPAKVVSERLGHANVAFTLNTYAHVVPAMDRDAADRVVNLIFGG